jgi:hypothetical protein
MSRRTDIAANLAKGDERRGRLGAAALVACAGASLAAMPAAAQTTLEYDPASADLIRTTPALSELTDQAQLYGARPIGEHQRSYWLPTGLRIGNWIVHPTLGAGVMFDDNIHRSSRNKSADLKAVFEPELRFRNFASPSREESARLGAGPQPVHIEGGIGGRLTSYLHNDEHDFVGGWGELKGGLHFDRATTLSFGLSTRYEQVEQLDLGEPDAAAGPVPYHQNRASIGITRDIGRFRATLSATFDSRDYRDIRARNGTLLDQDFRDTTIWSGQLETGYRFSPGYEATSRLRVLRQTGKPIDGRDRDATGYEALVGLTFETTPLWKWHLLAGYGVRDFDDPGRSLGTALLFDAGVRWLPTQRMQVTLAARRSLADGFGMDSDGRVETGATVRIDYDVWNNLLMFAEARYVWSETLGTARADELLGGRIGLEYYLSRNWLLTASYEHLRNASSEAAFDMSRNRVLLGAKYRF